MARKITTKIEASKEVKKPETESISISTVTETTPVFVSTTVEEEFVKETPIVTSLKVIGHLILDEKNEIRIEQSSNFWVHAYWTDGTVSVWVASFEINHSTTSDDIVKTVKRYVRDRFTFLAERTFVAQQSTQK